MPSPSVVNLMIRMAKTWWMICTRWVEAAQMLRAALSVPRTAARCADVDIASWRDRAERFIDERDFHRHALFAAAAGVEFRDDGAAMKFQTRQEQRRRLLERVVLASQVLAAGYLAVHALISWRAYEEQGAASALLTFVLLGFGDLYWALRWLYEDYGHGTGWVALVTAGVCFASWVLRPWYNAWIMSLMIEMLEDFANEHSSSAPDQSDATVAGVETKPGDVADHDRSTTDPRVDQAPR